MRRDDLTEVFELARHTVRTAIARPPRRFGKLDSSAVPILVEFFAECPSLARKSNAVCAPVACTSQCCRGTAVGGRHFSDSSSNPRACTRVRGRSKVEFIQFFFFSLLFFLRERSRARARTHAHAYVHGSL